MSPIEILFQMHEEGKTEAAHAPRRRFGSLWRPEEGIILYPPNGVARDYITLLRQTLPDIPLALCDDLPMPDANLNGLAVQPLATAAAALPRALFVLCTTGDETPHAFAHVAPFLSSAQINNMITFRQLGEFVPVGDKKSRAFDVYRKTFLAAAPRARHKVEAAYSLFTDPLSKAVFSCILKRYLLSSDAIIPVSTSLEYFENVYTRLPEEVFVDCGAYSGDTLQEFLKTGGRLGAYYAFEPDADNFARLCTYAESLPDAIRGRCHLFPHALGHEQATLTFDASGTMGSMVNPDGTATVECVTLDEALRGVQPTLIKFDIEGYEAFALQGGRELIRRARPVLALCVYHHPFDLWELPLMVHNMVDDYHFFLRAYQEQFSYTCYCVPSERLSRHAFPGTAS